MGEILPVVNFSSLFSTRGVDYQGEEIRVARKVVWESIEASLPAQVGTLELRSFCHSGVLHYIDHFEDFLVPVCDQTVGKAPRVFVDDCDWFLVAKGLMDRGICVAKKLSDLHHVGNAPLVNGLFAVSKDEFEGPVELCRLIMNLKPINSLTRPLEGDTCTLPMVTQLAALYLDEDEVLRFPPRTFGATSTFSPSQRPGRNIWGLANSCHLAWCLWGTLMRDGFCVAVFFPWGSSTVLVLHNIFIGMWCAKLWGALSSLGDLSGS